MKNKSHSSLTLCVAALLASAACAQAQVTLAQWEFVSNANVTTTHTDVTSASALSVAGHSFQNSGYSSNQGINLDGSTYGGSPIHNAGNNSWGGDNGRFFARPFDDTSINSNTAHFAFEITLASGKSYDLNNVWFDFGIREVSGNQISVQMSDNASFSNPIVLGAGEDTNTANNALGYFDDNGTTSIGLSNEQTNPNSNPTTGNKNYSWNRLDNTLNTPQTISGTTYFRIYVAGGQRNNDPADGNYIDNLTVTAVPEPSTYAAVLGLLALAGVAYRRRRR